MKRKIFKVAAAAMAVVCLAGCSAGNLTTDSVISAAKKYGMEETDSYREIADLRKGPTINSSKYYLSVDSEQASDMCRGFMNLLFVEDEVDSFVACVENWGEKTDDHKRGWNTLYLLTTKNEEDAQRIFDGVAEYEHITDKYSGEKNGITYRIQYVLTESSGGECICGLYKKGNTVILINGVYSESENNKFVELFCKELGLVSPYTLKKS